MPAKTRRETLVRRLEALLALLVFLGSLALAGIALGEDDEPTDRAFVLVSVSPAEPRTWEILTVTIRSKIWTVDQAGNATLAPNPGYVDVTLYDRAHDVRVASNEAAFSNGTAVAEFVVQPEWSDLRILAVAEDPLTRLRGELAFRTEYSMSYLLWKIREDWLASYNGVVRQIRDQDAATDAFERGMWAFAFGCTTFMLVTVFLRTEHRRARARAYNSIWDRLADWFPFSLVPEDLWIALHPGRAPPGYTDLAARWTKHRREAGVVRIEVEQARLEKAKDLVMRGVIDP